ncbi:MAG: DUF3105 domain-containing protein [Chloroflexi bacterium]|nr:DUF3105 domain-containing protein [Chloroflexota bacterium]
MAETKRKATTRPESRRGVTKGQIREERRGRARSRQRRKRSLLMFGGILFAIVFIAALVVRPSTSPGNSGERGVNTGGHIALDPDDGRGHIDGNTPYSDTYSVVPATSGAHWAGSTTPFGLPSPARWGSYDSVLPDEILIHNLEHGGIGFHYDCPEECPEIVKALDDIIPSSPSQYIMSPYPGLPSKIAITGWRHHLYLDEVDEVEIRRFIDEYQDRAPESAPQNQY